jgi:hypothetical protein
LKRLTLKKKKKTHRNRASLYHARTLNHRKKDRMKLPTSGLFGVVAVAVAFQIAFHAKMHVNNIFLFFKNYF